MSVFRIDAVSSFVTLVVLLLSWTVAHSADYDASETAPERDAICKSMDDDGGQPVAMSDEPCCWFYYLGNWWCLPC